MITRAPKPTVLGASLGLCVLAVAAIPLLSNAQVAPGAPAAPAAQAPAAPANRAAPTRPLAADGFPIELVEADVSTRSVAVTSSFTGTEIIVFGSVEHSRQPTAESGFTTSRSWSTARPRR